MRLPGNSAASQSDPTAALPTRGKGISKIATALGIFEENVNTEELRGRLNARKSSKVTPQMFEYALIEKAKKHRQHIVLPEGNDERILRAADILLRRGVADLTILGDAKTISSMTSQMGLNLAGANIVSPAASQNYEDYVSHVPETVSSLGRLFGIRIVSGAEYLTMEMIHTASARMGVNVPLPFYRGFPDTVRSLFPEERRRQIGRASCRERV